MAALALPLAAMPCAASADVLQIDGSGYQWIAGGPAQPFPGFDAAALAATAGTAGQEAPQPVDIALHPGSLTEVADAAGPEHWRLRVAELAAKYDISPALLEAVVWQESRWNERAVSPVGARGLAQLMPGTARMMGVNADDPNANLEGGARYLRLQLDAFSGDIELALAAYNAGPGRVIKAGGIPAIRETQNYVSSIMSRLSQPVRE